MHFDNLSVTEELDNLEASWVGDAPEVEGLWDAEDEEFGDEAGWRDE
jgi:hypothetical protein